MQWAFGSWGTLFIMLGGIQIETTIVLYPVCHHGDVFLDPPLHLWEVRVLHSRQSCDLVSSTVLIWFLLHILVDLEVAIGIRRNQPHWWRTQTDMQEKLILVSLLKCKHHLKVELTKQYERLSSTALFSPTSTNITAIVKVNQVTWRKDMCAHTKQVLTIAHNMTSMWH